MKIAIIGAGITGLSAAYELIKLGHQVEVFERADTPGGLGTYLKIGNTYLERYYHHFFASDKLIQQYAEELGIRDQLKFYYSKNAIMIHQQIYPFSGPLDLLTYSPLSLINRLRCLFSTAFLKLIPVPLKDLDTVPAIKWIEKYAGSEVLKTVWGPLLNGKFSRFANKVPALWLWGRIFDRTFKLGYFDGSVKVLFDGLINKIKSEGGVIHLSTEIDKVTSYKNFVKINHHNKNDRFDKVIVTTVSPIFTKMISNKLPNSYKNKLNKIDHLGAVCLILELKHSIQENYWLNLADKDCPVLVLIEHTNLVSKSIYKNSHIVYLANYLHRDDPRFRLSDHQILNEYTSILQKINPKFQSNWIKKHHISRVPRAQSIFQLNALKNKPPMETPFSNILLANIDQMYPHDRNLNQGIELGMKAAKLV